MPIVNAFFCVSFELVFIPSFSPFSHKVEVLFYCASKQIWMPKMYNCHKCMGVSGDFYSISIYFISTLKQRNCFFFHLYFNQNGEWKEIINMNIIRFTICHCFYLYLSVAVSSFMNVSNTLFKYIVHNIKSFYFFFYLKRKLSALL